MFGYLKKKLKTALDKFTSSAETQADEEIVEEIIEAPSTPVVEEEKTVPTVEQQVETKVEQNVQLSKDEQKKPERKTEQQPESAKLVEQPTLPQSTEVKQETTIEEEKTSPIPPVLSESHTTTTSTPSETKTELPVKQQPVTQKKEPSVEQHAEPTPEEKSVEKQGLFSRLKQSVTQAVTKKRLSEDKFEELFFELEMTLLENNVAVQVIDKIKADLHARLVDSSVDRGKIGSIVYESLKQSITEVLDIPSFDFIEQARSAQKPYVVAFVGINGSGKTTTMAKVAKQLQNNGLSVVMAASDTYRAAAIQQLAHHADALGIKLIKHDYGADPSAVAFDAVAHAKAKKIDVVLIDTAGRLHHNENLMNELHKLVRVAKPDLKLFVGESITGNDCVEQARLFNEKVGIDGIILTKADVDEKGGAALSISFVTKKPIVYIGAGQRYEDLQPYSKTAVIEQLGLA